MNSIGISFRHSIIGIRVEVDSSRVYVEFHRSPNKVYPEFFAKCKAKTMRMNSRTKRIAVKSVYLAGEFDVMRESCICTYQK